MFQGRDIDSNFAVTNYEPQNLNPIPDDAADKSVLFMEQDPSQNTINSEPTCVEQIKANALEDQILPPYLADALALDSGSEISDDDEELTEEILRQVLESDNSNDDDEITPTNNDHFSWSDDFTTFTGYLESFNEISGPTVSSTDPLQLFQTVWNDDIMRVIAHETNEYAWQTIARLTEVEGALKPNSRLNDWVEVTVEELYVFFSILIYMSLCYRGRLDEYWTTKTLEMPHFRQIMSKNRFILITRFLHFVDNDNLDVMIHGYDRKLLKIAPILEHCNQKFREMYVPKRHLSLDESLLLWKGRLSWIQSIRTKAARFGIKSYEICEAESGYLLKMKIYTGKNTSHSAQTEIHGFTGVTSKVVIEMATDYLNKGHCLVMDNYYNSVELTRFLKKHGTDVLGTLNRRRTGNPPIIKGLIDRNMKRGSMVSQHCGDITVLAWKDVKLLTMISTHHNNDMAPGQRAGVPCNKPVAVHSYNKYMGGVDSKDQKLSMYLLERKRGLKWYQKVFRRLINITVLNTYIIYKTKVDKTHREYRYLLAKALSQQRPIIQRTRPAAIVSRTELNEIRLDNIEHYPEHQENEHKDRNTKVRYKRGRCVRCLAKKQRTESNIKCTKCRVFLCVGKCWIDYHSLEQL